MPQNSGHLVGTVCFFGYSGFKQSSRPCEGCYLRPDKGNVEPMQFDDSAALMFLLSNSNRDEIN